VFARSAAILLIATLASIPATPSPAPAPDRRVPALGLAVNVADSASAPDRQEALDQVRAAGVSLFALEVAWPAAEPRPRRYDVAAVTRTARLLRQSGAVLHLDLPLVNGRIRQVPADLARAAFDDPKLTVRLGRLLDALGPALADFSTLSLRADSGADERVGHTGRRSRHALQPGDDLPRAGGFGAGGCGVGTGRRARPPGSTP